MAVDVALELGHLLAPESDELGAQRAAGVDAGDGVVHDGGDLDVVEHRLHSHGSVIMSSLQQAAGAAGTALFVTLMAVGASAATAESATDAAAATSAGVHSAFLVGACLSLAAVVLAAFVRGGAAAGDADGPVLAH